MTDKAWGGRFEQELNRKAAEFSCSVEVDRRLAGQDIKGSIAHARMLGQRGVLSPDEVAKITAGLERIAAEIASGDFAWDDSREDVHMNVEATLTERIGEAGAKLHTARSRNDQVATDMKMWTRQACRETAARIDRLLAVLAVRAGQRLDLLLPGYTHLQRAQPVRLAHHLLAWCEMLGRDRARLLDAAARMNLSPLGSGALAATSFDIDREATARELGFEGVTRNSMDAVADRDFSLESVSALAICAVHLSRICEELVLWSSQEFGFLRMSDAFTTGSSMMPQKRNPDMAELIRGKSGRVVGDLVSLLVMLKGLPLSYNRDMQEDKPPVFDAFDTVDDSLEVLAGSLAGARFDGARMRAALQEGFMEATELADYLATRGVPFRQAHRVVGGLVRRAAESGKRLADLTLDELKAEHPAFEEEVFRALDLDAAVERRSVVGGPARAAVASEVAALKRRLAERGVEVEKVAAEYGIGTGDRG